MVGFVRSCQLCSNRVGRFHPLTLEARVSWWSMQESTQHSSLCCEYIREYILGAKTNEHEYHAHYSNTHPLQRMAERTLLQLGMHTPQHAGLHKNRSPPPSPPRQHEFIPFRATGPYGTVSLSEHILDIAGSRTEPAHSRRIESRHVMSNVPCFCSTQRGLINDRGEHVLRH